MTYELDWAHMHDNYWISNKHLVSILTGIDPDEINVAHREVCRLNGKRYSKSWGGQMFVKVFHFVGFNTSGKFIKFDFETDKPCIMRCIIPGCHSEWYAFIYHDGLINNTWTVSDWQAKYKSLRITSMLQVWI